MLIYLSYKGVIVLASRCKLKETERFYRLLFTYYLYAALFKILLISLLGMNLNPDVSGWNMRV